MTRRNIGLRWLDHRLARRAPLLSGPAPALDGGLGFLPFSLPARRDGGLVRLPDGGSDGAAPPWFRLDPGLVGPADRDLHRHGWLAAAAWQGDATAALALLDRWLERDRPGHGPAWVHTTDLVARLLCWLVAVALLGPRVGAALRPRLAGSAALHLAHLETRLAPLAAGDPRRSLQLVGLAAGALGWPSLPGARERAGRVLTALGPALEALLDDDGMPRDGALPLLPELLAHLLLLRGLAGAARAPLPGAVTLALRRSLSLLAALRFPGSPVGRGAGLVAPLLPLEERPPIDEVLAAGAALGLVAPVAGCTDGALARLLAGSVPHLEPASVSDMAGLRARGLVVGSASALGLGSRLVLQAHAASGVPGLGAAACALSWSVGDLAVLQAPFPGRGAPGLPGNIAHLAHAEPAVEAALLDARLGQGTLRLRARAASPGSGPHLRTVELRGHRLRVEDRFAPPRGARPASVRVGWQLGPAWALRWEDGVLHGTAGERRLRIEPDPCLTWSLVRGADAPGGGWVEGERGEPVPALLLLGQGPLPDARGISCGFSLS